jgi:uncharacterized caspase-like protein
MLRRILCVVSLLAVAACGAAGPVLAQSRMALVIGNSAYQSVTALTNPSHDAQAVAQVLNSAGFDVVLGLDLTQAGMVQTIQDFANNVATKGSDSVALIYYAGHGVQVDGENFLVPVDATIQQVGDVASNTLALADLMKLLEAVPSSARIVILDACRNNPFEAIQKSTARGLAIVDAPDGSIVAYSTAPGAEALDGSGQNSPYAAALLETIKQPGLPIEQLFKEVRLQVHKATEGRQTPWESTSLEVNFAFFAALAAANPAAPGDAAVPAAANVAPVVPVAIKSTDISQAHAARVGRIRTLPPADAYDVVIEEDSDDAYQEFISVYSDDPLCDRIRRILFRRQQMEAWRNATLQNTPDAYETYLTRYPYSDHAANANRLHNDPRPIFIDPIIAPHNFQFPHFPSQNNPGQQNGPGQTGPSGPFKFPGQGGPVVSISPFQGQPGKPGGLNSGTPGQTGNPTTVIHLPPGLGLDTSIKNPVTNPTTVTHLPTLGTGVDTTIKTTTSPTTVVHLPPLGTGVDTTIKNPVTTITTPTVTHLPTLGTGVDTTIKTTTPPTTVVHLPPTGTGVDTTIKNPVTTTLTPVLHPLGTGTDTTIKTITPTTTLLHLPASGTGTAPPAKIIESNKSPVITTLTTVNHLPAVVDHLPPVNASAVTNSTHFPPVTSITSVKTITTTTNNPSNSGKLFTSINSQRGGTGFGGGQGGGIGGGQGGGQGGSRR